MACKNCKCHITEDDIRKMDYKRLNQLLNEMVDDKVCDDTQANLQGMIEKNIRDR